MPAGYKDYYAILGVKKDAGADEIKQAYRKLARQHHPDLHLEKDKAAQAEKFKEINEAYEVLSDPAKKATYDQVGEAPPPPPGGGGPGRRRTVSPEEFAGFSDFFGDLFGRGEAGRAQAAPQELDAELPLSLEDAYKGGERRFSIPVPEVCPSCGGSGRKGRSFCPVCGGVGERQTTKQVTVRLPRHVREGTRLRVPGHHLILTVRLLPHPRFRADGADLETTVSVPPWTAAVGGETSVPTLDGAVRVRVPPGTHSGRRLRIAGKGLGGDLYADIRIDLPERMSPAVERLFKEMKEAAE